MLHEFKKIENQSPLAVLFNAVFEEINIMRMVSTPGLVTFRNYFDSKNSTDLADNYYLTCLTEAYFHKVIERLNEWKNEVEKYNSEFAGSWKYYALTNHIDLIKEYGGEDGDYNADGTVRTSFTDKELKHSCIYNFLVDYNCIYLTTKASDLNMIYTILLNSSALNPFKVFEEIIGKPIDTYSKNENGEIIKNTWADNQIMDIKTQIQCDSLAEVLFSAITEVNALINEVNKLKWNKDNKTFFSQMPNRIEAILNLKIPIYALLSNYEGGSHV